MTERAALLRLGNELVKLAENQRVDTDKQRSAMLRIGAEVQQMATESPSAAGIRRSVFRSLAIMSPSDGYRYSFRMAACGTPDEVATVMREEGQTKLLTRIDALPQWHRNRCLLDAVQFVRLQLSSDSRSRSGMSVFAPEEIAAFQPMTKPSVMTCATNVLSTSGQRMVIKSLSSLMGLSYLKTGSRSFISSLRGGDSTHGGAK